MAIALPINFIAVASLALLGVGGLASMFHLGRPKRFFNAFANFGSHLTQEALITPFLGLGLLACAADGFVIQLGAATGIVYLITAVLSILFLISTGMVYHLSSRPAWNSIINVIIFLLTAAEVGTIATMAIILSLGQAIPTGLAGAALASFVLSLICQFIFTNRLKSVGYGVNVNVSQAPYRTTSTLWLVFSLAALAVALLCSTGAPSAAAAFAGVLCTLVSIASWTVLLFNVALKVKMFPMYSVDLNVNM